MVTTETSQNVRFERVARLWSSAQRPQLPPLRQPRLKFHCLPQLTKFRLDGNKRGAIFERVARLWSSAQRPQLPPLRQPRREVPLSTETDEVSGTATSVEPEIRASRTALVKRTATATPTAAATTTEVPSPTATDDIVVTTETSQRDVRASRTALVKRTATASQLPPQPTEVPLSTSAT